MRVRGKDKGHGETLLDLLFTTINPSRHLAGSFSDEPKDPRDNQHIYGKPRVSSFHKIEVLPDQRYVVKDIVVSSCLLQSVLISNHHRSDHF